MKRKYESVKRQAIREKLRIAMEQSFGYVLRSDDRFSFRHGYCDYNIVDVTITRRDGRNGTVLAYDTKRGCFPW